MAINTKQDGDNGYIVMFNDKQVEIYAPSLYQAKVLGIEHFKPAKSKAHLVTPYLCELADGSVATQSTCI